MCGIVGCYIHNGIPDINQGKAAIDALRHRGPDSQNYVQIENIFLGHSRLSIIDLANGNQPFSYFGKKYFSVINGELYDYFDIRRQLIKKGYPFNTNCDGEILIPLYLEYGLDVFHKIRGEFSFILWDRQKKIIIAARDQMGVKPLYYCMYNNNIYIASEIKSILKFDVPRVWNADTVYNINHGIFQSHYTCFKHINALNPGHFLLLENGQLTQKKYWDLSFPKRSSSDLSVNTKDYINQFKSIFADSVSTRLTADVPVGCYLSGGIDSTSVLAMASKLYNQKIKSFSIAFDDKIFDESDIAKKTAAFLSTDHHEVHISDRDIADNFGDSVWYGESIISNTHGVALYLLSKFVNKLGYKVVLTGAGADELLAGYSFFKEDKFYHSGGIDYGCDILNQIRCSPIGSGLVTTSKSQQFESLNIGEFTFLKHAKPTLFKMYKGRGKDFYGLYHSDFKEKNSSKCVVRELLHAIGDKIFNDLDVINISTYLFAKTTLTGYILSTIGDRMEMAHSVEGRVPFLDQKLVDFNMNLPLHLKLNGFNEKYILREAMKDMIPSNIYQRTKQPFCAPPANTFLLSLMNDIFHSRVLKNSPFYDYKKVIKLFNKLPDLPKKERVSSDSILTEILSTCLLEMRYSISDVY